MIDAHQHFWHYTADTHAWIDDDMAVIRRDFLPGDLEPLLEASNINGCVAVQAEQSENENHFLLSLAHDHPFIKGVVGWVDLLSPDISARLDFYKQYPLMRGFRHLLQGEEPAFMLRKEFLKGIGSLGDFGYTYDILIYPHQLTAATELVAKFPSQPFVIDHLAKPYIKKGLIEDWKKDLQKIATFPNTYCKLSGLVTEADHKNWKPEDIYPYLDVAVECFGMKRLMYGSDWPVCLVAGEYTSVLELVQQYFSNFTKHEQEHFFSRNAIQFYGLQ